MKVFFLAAALVVLSSVSVNQSLASFEVLDQHFSESSEGVPPGGPGPPLYGIPQDRDVAQVLTAGVTGVVGHIETLLSPQGHTGDATLSIYDIEDGFPNRVLGSVLLSRSAVMGFPIDDRWDFEGFGNVPFYWASFDFSSLGIRVEANQKLAIAVSTDGDNYSWAASTWGEPRSLYERGHIVWRNDEFTNGEWANLTYTENDFEFKTFVIVPEPASLIMVATAAVVLLLWAPKYCRSYRR